LNNNNLKKFKQQQVYLFSFLLIVNLSHQY